MIPDMKFVIACVPLFVSSGSCPAILAASCMTISIPASIICGIISKIPLTKTVRTCASESASFPELSVIPFIRLFMSVAAISINSGAYSAIFSKASETILPISSTIPEKPPSWKAAFIRATYSVANCAASLIGVFMPW